MIPLDYEETLADYLKEKCAVSSKYFEENIDIEYPDIHKIAKVLKDSEQVLHYGEDIIRTQPTFIDADEDGWGIYIYFAKKNRSFLRKWFGIGSEYLPVYNNKSNKWKTLLSVPAYWSYPGTSDKKYLLDIKLVCSSNMYNELTHSYYFKSENETICLHDSFYLIKKIGEKGEIRYYREESKNN